MMPELIKTTAKNFKINSVVADKAYSSRANIKLIYNLGATPYIPFRSNSTGNSKGTMFWSKAYEFFKYNEDEFKRYYSIRSNVESTFSMIKRKIGHKLRTKNYISQINEVLAKCLVHNLCVLCQEFFELRLDITFNMPDNNATNGIMRQNEFCDKS